MKKSAAILLVAFLLSGCSIHTKDLDITIGHDLTAASDDTSYTMPETTKQTTTDATAPESTAPTGTTTIPTPPTMPTTTPPKTTPAPTTTPPPATTPAPTSAPRPSSTPAPATAPPMTTLAPTTASEATTAMPAASPDLWIAAESDNMTAASDEKFTLKIAFGTDNNVPDNFVVTVFADDFIYESTGSEVYPVDGETYNAADFAAPDGTDSSISPSYDNLPMKFEISFERRPDRDMFFGAITVNITEYSGENISSVGVTIYYYGDREILAFSMKSQDDAKARYEQMLN